MEFLVLLRGKHEMIGSFQRYALKPESSMRICRSVEIPDKILMEF
jgi:hypothetical protein